MKLGYASAQAFGAATIVNAISSGYGAAFGLSLYTRARVSIRDGKGRIKVRILDDPGESTGLAEASIRRILKRFNLSPDALDVEVETSSNIPVARGLKSSSVAANAIVLAAVKALDGDLEDLEIVNIGCDAALDAGVTVTGAFDDACASYLGNVVVTDNRSRRLEKVISLDPSLKAILLIPESKAYTGTLDPGRLRRAAPLVKGLHDLALEGYWLKAMSLNGFIHSILLGYDPSPALEALEAGALAAGLSGKGPTTVALAEPEDSDRVAEALGRHPGELRIVEVNTRKAFIIEEL
ncbi:MAG: shikimate kinase [Candidatus Bathyarchaeia archaeon]